MKISFVATVYNEEKSILGLLKSLEAQSKRPDQVIIVDGGSTDKTVSVIKDFHKHSPLEIICLVKKCNRSRGRNLAIGKAIGEGIAVSDAGCVLDKNWLKQITAPLISHQADVVAGFYQMKITNLFTHCSAPFFGPMSHNINKTYFLPSSRSIAFTKKAWKKVGGYPTKLNIAAEDIVFAQKLFDDPSIKMTTNLKATVEWTHANSINKFFHDIKNHTLGNIEAGYVRHLKKNYFVALRYAFAMPLLLSALVSQNPYFIWLAIILSFIYLLYPSIKFIKLVKHPIHIFYFAFLQIIADIAVLSALFTRIKTSK